MPGVPLAASGVRMPAAEAGGGYAVSFPITTKNGCGSSPVSARLRGPVVPVAVVVCLVPGSAGRQRPRCDIAGVLATATSHRGRCGQRAQRRGAGAREPDEVPGKAAGPAARPLP
jgi:hypothetical protein